MGTEGEATSIPRPLRGALRLLMRGFARLNVVVYRLSNGRLMARAPGGAPVCLVTMTGHRSGEKRTVPLIHVPHGDAVVLVASQGGLGSHPDWYHNLVAQPAIGITVAGRTRRMFAREAQGAERDAAWAAAVAVYPSFASYQRRTSREIPLFICSPAR